jgi:endo-1,3-1,4-beta-glycanase ExoK
MYKERFSNNDSASRGCIFSALLAAGCLLTSAADAATPTWVDHFTSLSASRWYVSNGWSDGSWMLNNWERSQVSTGVNGLGIALNQNPAGAAYPYSSGEIQNLTAYRYGYFEARIQAPSGGGLDTGFFTYVGATAITPWNEIDVEILGKNTHAVQLTYHNGNSQVPVTVNLPFDASTAPHLYGFDWEPGYIRWYVDGKLVLQQTGANLPLPTVPQNLIINTWASNSFAPWLGLFTWPNHPITTRVTCVAVEPQFTAQPLC